MPSIAPGRRRSLAAENERDQKAGWLRISISLPNASSSAACLHLHYAFLMAFYLHSQMEGERALRGYGQNCCRPR
jgi:hypothetical protein